MSETNAEVDERYLFHYAAEYRDRGYSVFPLRTDTPAIPRLERPTLGQLAIWFGVQARGSFNIGIVTGEISGLVVVEFDREDEVLCWLKQRPATPLMVSTGCGGRHLYYQYPADGLAARGLHSKSRGFRIRADGEYVTAPPSRDSKTGRLYEWLGNHEEYSLADVPVLHSSWLVA